MMDYAEFIARKSQLDGDGGFKPEWMPSFLFDFQASLVDWSLRKGRAAIFADCGLGKSPMELVWAQNVVRRENGRVLLLTPLSVGAQFVREGEKFGVEVTRVRDGKVGGAGVYVTNYERLHHFNPSEFAGVVCDESSILKSFDGETRANVTRFMLKTPWRLLATATAAPNDFTELGTSSEALGYLGHMDMLARFFKNQNGTCDTKGHWRGNAAPRIWEGKQWRFRGHSEEPFWRWVASWARSLRRPSDLGFDDGGFVLPPLERREHVVKATRLRDGELFATPAIGLAEEREERRRTLQERCEKAAALVADTGKPAVLWCHLNDEGDLLEKLVAGAVQVSGADGDDEKEEKLTAFVEGKIRVLVTKPVIAAWGLNWQHCAHMVTFASHSFEQDYQSTRRSWRFGQKQPVLVEYVVSDGEQRVIENLQRKAEQAERMHAELTRHMTNAIGISRGREFTKVEEVPTWL
jgi:hypothetical protein